MTPASKEVLARAGYFTLINRPKSTLVLSESVSQGIENLIKQLYKQKTGLVDAINLKLMCA